METCPWSLNDDLVTASIDVSADAENHQTRHPHFYVSLRRTRLAAKLQKYHSTRISSITADYNIDTTFSTRKQRWTKHRAGEWQCTLSLHMKGAASSRKKPGHPTTSCVLAHFYRPVEERGPASCRSQQPDIHLFFVQLRREAFQLLSARRSSRPAHVNQRSLATPDILQYLISYYGFPKSLFCAQAVPRRDHSVIAQDSDLPRAICVLPFRQPDPR